MPKKQTKIKKRSSLLKTRNVLFIVTLAVIGAVATVATLLLSRADTTNYTYTKITGSPVGINSYNNNGAWVAASDGGVFALGSADSKFYGSMGGQALAAPMVGIAVKNSANGYWMTAADGGVFAYGDAQYLGRGTNDCGNIADIASGNGNAYALVSTCGKVFSYGFTPAVAGAKDMTGFPNAEYNNREIVAIAIRPQNDGYWLVSKAGKIFGFGAPYKGGVDFALNAPIVDIMPTTTGEGYWLIAKDGGVFAYGDATFHGSATQFTDANGNKVALAGTIVGGSPTPSNKGYYLLGSDGGVFAFGDAVFPGRVVASTPTPTAVPTKTTSSTGGSSSGNNSGNTSGGTSSGSSSKQSPNIGSGNGTIQEQMQRIEKEQQAVIKEANQKEKDAIKAKEEAVKAGNTEAARIADAQAQRAKLEAQIAAQIIASKVIAGVIQANNNNNYAPSSSKNTGEGKKLSGWSCMLVDKNGKALKPTPSFITNDKAYELLMSNISPNGDHYVCTKGSEGQSGKFVTEKLTPMSPTNKAGADKKTAPTKPKTDPWTCTFPPEMNKKGVNFNNKDDALTFQKQQNSANVKVGCKPGKS